MKFLLWVQKWVAKFIWKSQLTPPKAISSISSYRSALFESSSIHLCNVEQASHLTGVQLLQQRTKCHTQLCTYNTLSKPASQRPHVSKGADRWTCPGTRHGGGHWERNTAAHVCTMEVFQIVAFVSFGQKMFKKSARTMLEFVHVSNVFQLVTRKHIGFTSVRRDHKSARIT